MRISCLLAAPFLLCAAAAAAQDDPLPEAARAMIEAAMATGDADGVGAVIAAARAAFPGHAAEIDAMQAQFQAQVAERAAAAAEAQQAQLRSAGVFDNWSGRGEVGGFLSTGNTEEMGGTASLTMQRDGIDWQHRLRLAADYRRSNGVTTREQLLAQYEPRFQINRRLFAFGLAQFERDSLQGFSARYAGSGGLGYRVVDTDELEFSIKAGPAYRVTRFNSGATTSRIAGLLGADFDWQITDLLKFTQDANATAETGGEVLLIVDGSNTSLTAVSGLEAGLSSSLTARVSYTVEYDSNPPAGSVGTDTLTRFTLIYGF
jgi:putative salt-induced outer membrane protein